MNKCKVIGSIVPVKSYKKPCKLSLGILLRKELWKKGTPIHKAGR